MKIFKLYFTDNLVGKLCLLGFLAPVATIIITRYLVSDTSSWAIWLYLLSFFWLSIALFRSLFITRCPNCESANNSNIGKREIERYVGKKKKKIQVGTQMLSMGKIYDFYNVPVTIIKTGFSFKCHNCQTSWETIRDIPADENKGL